MHTQKETAKTIIGYQADYVMLVKGNQPSLLEDIQLIFQHQEAFADRFSVSETIDLGHGRLENRRLMTNSELVGYTAWPNRCFSYNGISPSKKADISLRRQCMVLQVLKKQAPVAY